MVNQYQTLICLLNGFKGNLMLFPDVWNALFEILIKLHSNPPILLPSSHLPRTPCNKFVYDFLCEFWSIVGGYGLRRMSSHFLRASCDFFYGASGATRGKSVQRLCGDCTEIMQCQCSCRAVSAASARKSYGACAGIVQCHLYVRHVYRLLAYNFFQICKTSR